MADSEKDKSAQKPPAKKEEMPVERRLLLAFILMGAVLFTTQLLYKPGVPPEGVKQKEPAKPQQAAKPAAEPPIQAAAAPTEQIAAAKEEFFTVETRLYKVVFSNHGAVVRSWILKNYRDAAGKPLELVNKPAAQKVHYPFAIQTKGQSLGLDVNQALYASKPVPGGLGVDYTFSNGAVSIHKAFRFQQESYLSEVATEVTWNGQAVPHLLAWRGGFGDYAVPGGASSHHTIYYNTADNKLVVNEAKVAKNGPVSVTAPFSFAGLEDTYFAAVFLPKGRETIEIQTLSDAVPSPADPKKEEPHVGAAVGGEARNAFSLYVGPKDIDLLKKVSPKLEQVVDFGTWFGFLARPLFLALNWVNNHWVHNYGWSIVLVTIVINFLLLPLKFSSLKSMKKMQVLQPQIAAINEKYRNIGLRDPRKAEQNQEVMALYKKHGVNPAGGCVPLLLQIPFFIAFYTVLSVSIEMRGANWLWVTDLSQPETIPIRILPLLMIGTQFFLQKMTPATTMDPAQQKIMLMMPLFMGFMFYGISSGLVLYWLTGNVVGIVQQWFFNRVASAPAVAPVPAVAKSSPKRKSPGR